MEVLWDNGETSWEPLAVIGKDDLVTLAKCAKDRKLEQQRGWKWARKITKNEKKFVRMMKLMKASDKPRKKNFGPKCKFGVEVPRTGDVKGADELDRKTEMPFWFNARKDEATALRKLMTFELQFQWPV